METIPNRPRTTQSTGLLRRPILLAAFGELGARDLAVDPGDPNRLAGTDWDAQLWVSDDGAAT